MRVVTEVSRPHENRWTLAFNGWSAPWSQPRAGELLAKRSLDIVVASVLILSLLPLLLLVSLVIRCSSPGPVLFSQVRVGKGGNTFRIYKFRTMAANNDPSIHQAYTRALINGAAERCGGTFKLVSDPRVTHVGRVLRHFSVDELPQLFNVLKGEMSLVGPRPSLPYEVELYRAREQARLAVMPGITGLWQVSGRSAVSFQRMVDLDLAYIEHWSIWLDFQILLRTPLVVITGRGAC